MKVFRYAQTTGLLAIRNGDYDTPIADCYAGAPGFVNDPDAQCLKNSGPLPRAVYSMRVVHHSRFAKPAIQLLPHEGDLCGRSHFWIHGDNSKGNRSASEGCIVADFATRRFIEAAIRSGFDKLEVVV